MPPQATRKEVFRCDAPGCEFETEHESWAQCHYWRVHRAKDTCVIDPFECLWEHFDTALDNDTSIKVIRFAAHEEALSYAKALCAYGRSVNPRKVEWEGPGAYRVQIDCDGDCALTHVKHLIAALTSAQNAIAREIANLGEFIEPEAS